MNNEYSITITTFPEKESAKETAKMLISRQLAACVQMFPIESAYLWKGEVCEDNEVMLLIKSKTALFDGIADVIKVIHPYEVAEIVQIPITDGLPEYLRWIDDCTKDFEA